MRRAKDGQAADADANTTTITTISTHIFLLEHGVEEEGDGEGHEEEGRNGLTIEFESLLGDLTLAIPFL